VHSSRPSPARGDATTGDRFETVPGYKLHFPDEAEELSSLVVSFLVIG
jgi:hypothetical protein